MNALKFQWVEVIGLDHFMHRAKVHGGWIVIVVDQTYNGLHDRPDLHHSGFFYPDPQHVWTGGSIEPLSEGGES